MPDNVIFYDGAANKYYELIYDENGIPVNFTQDEDGKIVMKPDAVPFEYEHAHLEPGHNPDVIQSGVSFPDMLDYVRPMKEEFIENKQPIETSAPKKRGRKPKAK